MSKVASKPNGFTIVELLIVIVVIGILAAITIVAYNGITQKANIASIQSDLDNARKQLGMDQANTGSFPATAALANNGAGLATSPGTTYQYVVNNSASPQTYCLAATKGTTTFYITNANNVPTAGSCTDAALIGEWKFNGNANDSSPSGINGTIVGATLTNGKDGSTGSAYNLSGSGQYIVFGNSTTYNSPDITFTAWIKPSVISGQQEIMAKEMQYKYRLSGGNIDVLVSANGTAWTAMNTATASITAGNWYNVAVTISSTANAIVVYVNGAQVGSFPLGGAITNFNTNALYAGTYNGGGEMFNGAIDDMRVYNRALTAAEIQSVYTSNSF